MIELALEFAHDLVPFSHGDTVDQTGAALANAIAEGAKQEPGSMRATLYALQAAGSQLPPVEMPLQHVYAPGVCARTIFIPAGTFVVGKIHKHQHLNILSQGVVDVLTEGGGHERLTGPLTMTSPPGTKRALLTLTDTTWTTIHVTDITDLAELEDFVIAKSYEDYERWLIEGDPPKRLEVQS